jgi:hypothetical protein
MNSLRRQLRLGIPNSLFLALVVLGLVFFSVDRALAAITLNYFRATSESSGIFLEWETLTEPDNDGFYIQRSLVQDSGYARLDVYILSDSLLGEGVSYNYLDEEILPGTRYYYKLESVALDDTRVLYGPISAVSMGGAATSTPTATRTATPSSSDGSPTATASPNLTITATNTPAETATPTPPVPTEDATQTQMALTETATELPEGWPTEEPTQTPTLEALPTFEFLFPAPTATRALTATSTVRASPTSQNTLPPVSANPLSPRYLVLFAVILLLWIALAVFLVIILRKAVHPPSEPEEKLE